MKKDHPKPSSTKKSKGKLFPVSKDQMLQLILDNIPSRIFWKNRDSIYLGSNRVFAEDAGVSDKDDIAGLSDHDMAWKKSEADFFIEMDQKVMDNDRREIGIIEPQKHADGKESWLETNKIPLKNKEGEVIGILGTYTDITEERLLLESLKKKNAELEFKNNELEQYAFVASHDLQEPLRTIVNYIDLFETDKQKELSKEGQMYFSFIKDASVRMQGLVSGLLDYARIGRNIKFEWIDCEMLLQDVKKELKESIELTKANITIDTLPKIRSSKNELQFIFKNLIENAIKFRKTDTSPHISISAKEMDDYWQFTIDDDGIGIEPQHKDKIFHLYQRLNNKMDYEGHGLGLTHCKKILDIFDGDIWLDTSNANQTTFHFTIHK